MKIRASFPKSSPAFSSSSFSSSAAIIFKNSSAVLPAIIGTSSTSPCRQSFVASPFTNLLSRIVKSLPCVWLNSLYLASIVSASIFLASSRVLTPSSLKNSSPYFSASSKGIGAGKPLSLYGLPITPLNTIALLKSPLLSRLVS